MDLNCHIGRQRWIHPEKSMTEGFERVKIANLIKYNAKEFSGTKLEAEDMRRSYTPAWKIINDE